MCSVGNMFARRAAASESSHARDQAKANLLRWNEKHEREISMQEEKISALRRDRDSLQNAAIRRGVEKRIEQEQQVLEELRATLARLTRTFENARSTRNNDAASSSVDVDVLAEISAHSLPLGKVSDHHATPTMYEWGPNVDLPEVSRQEVENAFTQATDPIAALTPPVAPNVRSASAKLPTLGGGAKFQGDAPPAVEPTVQQMLSPSKMLALQQQAMEKRLKWLWHGSREHHSAPHWWSLPKGAACSNDRSQHGALRKTNQTLVPPAHKLTLN